MLNIFRVVVIVEKTNSVINFFSKIYLWFKFKRIKCCVLLFGTLNINKRGCPKTINKN